MIDAMSPANFLATNPEAQQRLIDTQGESLRTGILNALQDLGKGKVSQTDESAFEVGKNVATAEGAVVYQTKLFQILQFKPLTDQVYERPYVSINITFWIYSPRVQWCVIWLSKGTPFI